MEPVSEPATYGSTDDQKASLYETPAFRVGVLVFVFMVALAGLARQLRAVREARSARDEAEQLKTQIATFVAQGRKLHRRLASASPGENGGGDTHQVPAEYTAQLKQLITRLGQVQSKVSAVGSQVQALTTDAESKFKEVGEALEVLRAGASSDGEPDRLEQLQAEIAADLDRKVRGEIQSAATKLQDQAGRDREGFLKQLRTELLQSVTATMAPKTQAVEQRVQALHETVEALRHSVAARDDLPPVPEIVAGEIEALKQDLDDRFGSLSALIKEASDETLSLATAARDESEQAKRRTEAVEAEVSEVGETLAQTVEKVKRLNDRQAGFRDETRGSLGAVDETLRALSEEVKALGQRATEAEDRLSAPDGHEDLSAALQEIRERDLQLSAEVGRLSEQVEDLRDMPETVGALAKSVAEVRNLQQSQANDVADLPRRLRDLEKSLSSCQKEIVRLEAQAKADRRGRGTGNIRRDEGRESEDAKPQPAVEDTPNHLNDLLEKLENAKESGGDASLEAAINGCSDHDLRLLFYASDEAPSLVVLNPYADAGAAMTPSLRQRDARMKKLGLQAVRLLPEQAPQEGLHVQSEFGTVTEAFPSGAVSELTPGVKFEHRQDPIRQATFRRYQ